MGRPVFFTLQDVLDESKGGGKIGLSISAVHWAASERQGSN